MERSLRMLRPGDWELLIRRIRDGKCTPFLGAGASTSVLPLAREIAHQWAIKYDYPMPDSSDDLIKVSQFLAVEYQESLFPKEQFRDQFDNFAKPNFNLRSEIHDVLAEVSLPLYLTTNYDDFMKLALERRGKKPVQEWCRWYEINNSRDATGNQAEDKPILDQDPDFEPTKDHPVVYHLHGHMKLPQSMVLTEDDYLDFLISVAEDRALLPHWVTRPFTDTSLLFLGYSLADPNFRVVFRSLVSYLRRNYTRAHVSVQLTPGGLSPNQMDKALAYLDSYFRELKVRVYWGTCEEFALDLREKMGI